MNQWRSQGAEGPCAEACDGPPSNKAVKKFICILQLNVYRTGRTLANLSVHSLSTSHAGKTRKLCYRKDDRAMRPIYRRPENFGESMTMPTPPCLQNF